MIFSLSSSLLSVIWFVCQVVILICAQMVLSLVNLCAREVVSDHSSSPYWLSCVPRELYQALLDAAFTHCRPLAVGELVQRWPERTLTAGGSRRAGQSQCPPNRLCVQALLLAVVRGLTDKR